MQNLYQIRYIFIVLIIPLALCNLKQRLMPFDLYCEYHKYPVQEHLIQTQDAYVLKFFRLQGKGQNISSGKPVIYLQHGLADSSDTWIVNSEEKAPAFIFANQGYDVWVGNIRGNKHSSPNLTQDSVKAKYWMFSFDQMAQYDLPAAFNYINNKTNQKINYIGHSQGTMIMFAALSQKNPVVRKNINSFFALGPVAYLQNQNTNLLNTLKKLDPTNAIFQILIAGNVNPILQQTATTQIIVSQVCYVDKFICLEGLKFISDAQPKLINAQRLPVVLSHYPSGTSAMNLLHFQQLSQTPDFQKFNYRSKRLNQKHYGTPIPPIYDLGNIEMPVHLYVGEFDKLATKQDAAKIMANLKNSIGKTITYINSGHAGFLWGENMDFYNKILEQLKQYN